MATDIHKKLFDEGKKTGRLLEGKTWDEVPLIYPDKNVETRNPNDHPQQYASPTGQREAMGRCAVMARRPNNKQ